LTAERDQIDMERREIEKSRHADAALICGLESQVSLLKGEMVRLEVLFVLPQSSYITEKTQLRNKIDQMPVNSNPDKVQEAYEALSKKDSQMQQLENALRESNKCITLAREERIKTVEEYELKIQKFHEDYILKSESLVHVKNTEKDLTAQITKKHKDKIAQLKQDFLAVEPCLIIRKLN
jgi:glucosamine 6-phosphate synthetase-like amidotransferase/phosphosugar isomerase protein